MSTRFFQSVRRNQKQWMVVVTVLSMVSFLFLDDFGRGKGPMSALGGALMIGSLCAAGMCIIGYPRQKTLEFGVGGFLVGFLAGFVGFGAVGANKPIVRTSIGSMTRSDLDELARQRQKLNMFFSAAARKAEIPQGMPYVELDDQPVVLHQLRVAEAKKMGIQITDARVKEFLLQITRNRLSKRDFAECLREARLGEGELFDLLRAEIAADLVTNLTEPPGYVPPLPSDLGMNLARFKRQIWYMQETPEQLWSTYEKLHVKESLLAAAIPVKDFVSKVADPSETELLAFFEKFKDNQWTDEARPGFTTLPRVQIAYLTGDFQNFEKGQEPTEEEVQTYYDNNKKMFPVNRAKESTAPDLPDDPADALKPESPVDEAAKSVEEETSTDPEKKGEPKSEVDGKKPDGDRPKDDSPDKQKDSDKPKDAKPSDDPKSSCGEEGAAQKPAAEESQETKAAPADEKAKAPAAPEDKPDTDKPDADKSEKNQNGEKSDEPSGSSLPKLSKSPSDFPPPEFQELDDELKLRIREIIVTERAFAQLAAELDKAREFMVDLSLEYDTITNAEKKREMAKTLAEKLLAYAIEHKLEYKQTSELTYEELNGEMIGRATDTRDRASVADAVFTQGQRGEPRLPLYSPRRADMKAAHVAIAYWKTGELPSRISDLKDVKVREQAIAAWKFDKARPLAEERAKELVKKAKAEKEDLAAALSGESVTGAKSEEQISIIPTIDFSWLTMNRSFPGSGGGPRISTIPLINNIGDNFMKTVFDEVANGETGVAVDEPKAVYYVVKVIDRDVPKDDDGGVAKREWHERFMKEDFASQFFPYMPSAYQSMAQYPQHQIDLASAKRAAQQFRVDWEDAAAVRQRR